MRIALVLMPSWSVLTAPLGIASVAATLVRAGHEAKTFDFNVQLWQKFRSLGNDPWNFANSLIWETESAFEAQYFPRFAPEIDKLMDEVAAWQPEVVGFSLFSTSIHCSKRAAMMLKEKAPQVKIIYGGPEATRRSLEWNRYFAPGFLDAVVIGEAEQTAVELIHRLQNHLPLDGCQGIAHQAANGEIVYEPTRPNIDLKDLPVPNFHEFALDLYQEPSLPVMMSRGCTAKCTFCAESRFWSNFRFRDAPSILAEFLYDKRTYGVARFQMSDSLINGNFKVLSELADLLIQNEEKIQWGGYARLDKRMTPDLLQRLAAAGVTYLNYGLETGSQKVMDLMEKRTTVEVASDVILNTHLAGIKVSVNVIVGFPGETEEDFLQTLDFLEKHKEFIDTVSTGSTLWIMDNTPLQQNPKKFGIRTNSAGNVVYDQQGNWISDDQDGQNTISIRRDRLARLRRFLDEQKINRVPVTEEKIQERMRPAFIHWSLDGQEGLSPAQSPAKDFRYWFDPVISRGEYSVEREIFHACQLINEKRKGRPVALCYSGGVDSEAIALSLHALKIPFELYFLDIWGLNRPAFDQWSPPLLQALGKEARIIRLEKLPFYLGHSRKIFQEFGCEMPTYLAMTYLFEQIPRTHFIIAGDGDLDRSGVRYDHLREQNFQPEGEAGRPLPFSFSQVFYYLWAEKYKRPGEYYFYSSTPGLIAAVVSSPQFRLHFPHSDTREVMYAAFPEIQKRPKTTNWDSPLAFAENVRIRNWLKEQAKRWPEFENWQGNLTTIASVDQIFHPSPYSSQFSAYYPEFTRMG